MARGPTSHVDRHLLLRANRVEHLHTAVTQARTAYVGLADGFFHVGFRLLFSILFVFLCVQVLPLFCCVSLSSLRLLSLPFASDQNKKKVSMCGLCRLDELRLRLTSSAKLRAKRDVDE